MGSVNAHAAGRWSSSPARKMRSSGVRLSEAADRAWSPDDLLESIGCTEMWVCAALPPVRISISGM